jgi:hypothetical protein
MPNSNERVKGENWHYTVKKEGISFESFLFNDLNQLSNPVLSQFYRKLFELYVVFGESFPLKAFEEQAGPVSDPETKVIRPAVFWYPAGVGEFAWHQHPGDYQNFQLLTNLTRPHIDYNGGETRVRMSEALTETFNDRFEQGDVFSFPYTRWHMVSPVLAGTSGLNARVSLLMPLGPPKGVKTYYADAKSGDWA